MHNNGAGLLKNLVARWTHPPNQTQSPVTTLPTQDAQKEGEQMGSNRVQMEKGNTAAFRPIVSISGDSMNTREVGLVGDKEGHERGSQMQGTLAVLPKSPLLDLPGLHGTGGTPMRRILRWEAKPSHFLNP